MHAASGHSEDLRTNRVELPDKNRYLLPNCQSNRKVVIKFRVLSGRRPIAKNAPIGALLRNDADPLSTPPVGVEITITG